MIRRKDRTRWSAMSHSVSVIPRCVYDLDSAHGDIETSHLCVTSSIVQKVAGGCTLHSGRCLK